MRKNEKMKKYRVRIDSYFSLPTDLSCELSGLPQYSLGAGYSVELKSEVGSVVTELIPARDDDSEYVLVTGQNDESLFHIVLGIVVNTLSKNSDNVFISQWPEES